MQRTAWIVYHQQATQFNNNVKIVVEGRGEDRREEGRDGELREGRKRVGRGEGRGGEGRKERKQGETKQDAMQGSGEVKRES